MITVSKTSTQPRSTFLDVAKRFADELHRIAERRVAYQYDQPWKARRTSAGAALKHGGNA